jgi:dCMP deaminase
MRPTRDEYFAGLARAAAQMSTCPKLHVGAVVVKNRRVVSTGYNGAPRGLPHCVDVGCELVNNHCIRTVHAEANALIQAGFERTNGATLYVTHSPCRACAGLIINAGIQRVVFVDTYGDQRILKLLKSARVAVKMLGRDNAA